MSKPVTAAPWSFSRIKAFEQCPKQFYHEKVLKQYPFRETEAIIDKETGVGWIIDYKTGKSAKYADKGQLELMALAIFKHYPEVTKLHAGLLFVIAKSLVKAEYEFDAQQLLWSKWLANYAKMEKAFEVDVWNPKPSGLCKRYCQVVECHHNGAN